ncbi:DUF4129 domain-containing protein [Flavobacterium cerinum]|uniref:DUF4129 domain-containing protein n=1 Tax=Flavobacterium cerinum TaxID=2502784 RepID=A0ABY5ITJ6_9FLAO|nr:DUF4129 domain-containing protein [Flavobacterium cerinum]UUC45487.1 DUF4129 domain-containing protein [Flavobacterium cerinum]
MNKILLYIILITTSFIAYPQANTEEVIPYTEQENRYVEMYSDTTSVTPLQFRPQFKENYSGSDFQYETMVKDRSSWEKFKNWFLYWLSRIFSFGFNKTSSSALEITLKIIAFLIILFVVYMIAKSIINKEGSWIFGKSSKKKIDTSDIEQEDIHMINFEKMIRDSKNNNDYRLAIRYYYLWLLKRLTDKTVIEWDIEKTNSDYLYEISDLKLRKDFAYLSYIYDYSWYGEFTLDETAFIRSEKAFLNTFNSL